MLTDTHCHFEDIRYDDDRENIIEQNLEELAFAVNVSTGTKDFDKIIQFTSTYDNLYASLGVHPHYALQENPEDVAEILKSTLKDQNKNNKIIGIGECGFDYYWENQDLAGRTEYEVKEAQRALFKTQIQIAKEFDLPLILHCRPTTGDKDAYIDCLEVLAQLQATKAVAHSFAGDLQLAEEFVNRGYYLGISGMVTFDPKPSGGASKSGNLQQVVAQIPLEKLLIETDAPYLTPVPHRGQRNEPRFTRFVAAKISEIKNIQMQEVLKVTEKNARELFGI